MFLTRASDICEEGPTVPWADGDDTKKALMQIEAAAGFESKWGD
jgi:hypothetical protein